MWTPVMYRIRSISTNTSTLIINVHARSNHTNIYWKHNSRFPRPAPVASLAETKYEIYSYSLQVTHNASTVTPINYWWNCTEGVWWPCYIGSDIWFPTNLWEASSLGSRAVSQRLGILRKSWRVFHDRSLLERCCRGFVLPVLEYCSAVWCSAADTHLKLLDRAVSGARFLTEGAFEYDISHRRSVAVLCMLYKIRCNLMHPLNDALPGPYVPAW